ncbi:hypothetical protein MPY17_40560 (plasmid) [Rhodococcus opacus]|nr:hypothetical protein [Rhodococcus opacus]UUK33966.1 hypothetical protein MPY17_40560 [Rhodococcus opacus]
MYRTGDLVRWDAAGRLVFIGRGDFQVKIRGSGSSRGGRGGAVGASGGGPGGGDRPRGSGWFCGRGGRQLVGYVVPAIDAGGGRLAGEVREFAAARLPGFMVPAAVVVLDRLPLTVSGKVDRRALPAPEFGSREFRAPRGPVEEALAGCSPGCSVWSAWGSMTTFRTRRAVAVGDAGGGPDPVGVGGGGADPADLRVPHRR